MNSLDKRLLLQHVLGLTGAQLLANPHPTLTPEQEKRMALLTARRESHEPLAYILGSQPFFGLDFMVTSKVLIPRPETEGLVEKVIAYAKANSVRSIIDVGTGSGAIAISLAKNLPDAQVMATDISSAALELAKQNAATNKVTVAFLEADLLDSLNAEVIVANLPYVPSARIAQLEPDVKDFEPHLALDGGPDGLDLYRKLASQVKALKTKPRVIFCEIDETHGGSFMDLWSDSSVVIEQDLAGLNRYATIKPSVYQTTP